MKKIKIKVIRDIVQGAQWMKAGEVYTCNDVDMEAFIKLGWVQVIEVEEHEAEDGKSEDSVIEGNSTLEEKSKRVTRKKEK